MPADGRSRSVKTNRNLFNKLKASGSVDAPERSTRSVRLRRHFPHTWARGVALCDFGRSFGVAWFVPLFPHGGQPCAHGAQDPAGYLRT